MADLKLNPIRTVFARFRQNTTGGKLFFRVFEIVTIALCIRFAWQWSLFVRQLNELVEPVGLAQYVNLNALAGSPLVFAVAGACTLLLLAGFFRMKPAFSYGGALLLLHVLYVARHSLGKLTHGSAFAGVLLLALFLGFCFFHGRERQQTFILGFACFSIGLAYLLSAASKLVASGLAWAKGENLQLWIGEKLVDTYAGTAIIDLNAIQQLLLTDYQLATAALAIGLLTELMAFLFWYPWLRPYIATLLIAMHLGIAVTMHILFSTFVIVLLLLGYPWPILFDALLNASPRLKRRIRRML